MTDSHAGHGGHSTHADHAGHASMSERGDHSEHASMSAHAVRDASAHRDHAGHGTDHAAQFRRLFWANLVLAVPVVGFSSMFAMMMIPHHEQAIEMSDVILAKSEVDQGVLDLAQQIKDAQGPEIELMESWLDAWGMPSSGGMGGMDHGDGMMSDADMAALEAADGAEAAQLFLEQMIEHHEGAIEMAQDELDDGVNPDVLALADRIIVSQTAEIATMRELLAQL